MRTKLGIAFMVLLLIPATYGVCHAGLSGMIKQEMSDFSKDLGRKTEQFVNDTYVSGKIFMFETVYPFSAQFHSNNWDRTTDVANRLREDPSGCLKDAAWGLLGYIGDKATALKDGASAWYSGDEAAKKEFAAKMGIDTATGGVPFLGDVLQPVIDTMSKDYPPDVQQFQDTVTGAKETYYNKVNSARDQYHGDLASARDQFNKNLMNLLNEYNIDVHDLIHNPDAIDPDVLAAFDEAGKALMETYVNDTIPGIEASFENAVNDAMFEFDMSVADAANTLQEATSSTGNKEKLDQASNRSGGPDHLQIMREGTSMDRRTGGAPRPSSRSGCGGCGGGGW